MPIEFSTWQARMANSILDTSIIDKDSELINSLSPLQKRMLIADLVVPIVVTENDLASWVAVFCVTIDTQSSFRASIARETLDKIIGKENSISYTKITGSIEAMRWKAELCADINKGTITRD